MRAKRPPIFVLPPDICVLFKCAACLLDKSHHLLKIHVFLSTPPCCLFLTFYQKHSYSIFTHQACILDCMFYFASLSSVIRLVIHVQLVFATIVRFAYDLTQANLQKTRPSEHNITMLLFIK